MKTESHILSAFGRDLETAEAMITRMGGLA